MTKSPSIPCGAMVSGSERFITKILTKQERRTLWKTSSSVCPIFCPSRVW
nr:MAG TPA: hypothetical protein [Caudoviricetes sp.]